MLINRQTMQAWGEQIALLPQLQPYLELPWLKLIVGSAGLIYGKSDMYVILCGNMDKSKFYPTQVNDFLADFRCELIYKPSTFVEDILKITGATSRYRVWPCGVSDYGDHWDFGWSMNIWIDNTEFEATYPSITIKEAINV